MSAARLRRRLLPALAGLAAAVLVPAAELRAQDTIPARPDSVRRDSAAIPIPAEAVRADTIPDAVKPDSVPADSTLPAPNFPAYPAPRETGFSAATWVFGRDELARFHDLSLLELLDRIPGLVITREGGPGRPAGVSTFASGGRRLRIFLDGWELRPLSAASPDPQQIPLVDVREIRVTRGLHEARVEVLTLRMSDRRPFAQIEGGEGDFTTRMLRGIFVRPVGRRLMVHVGLDVVETSGFRRAQDFSANSGVARLSYAFSDDRGLMLEYRTTGVDTERSIGGETTPRESFDRGELVLRGRGRLFGGVWLDGAVGRSWSDPLADDDSVTLERESVQGMLRATVDVPLGTLTGTARVHRVDEEGFAASATELSARAELTPAPWIAAWGEARALTPGGGPGVELEAAGRAGPWAGFSLFGTAAAGTRGLRFWRDSTMEVRNLAHEIDPDVQELDTVDIVLFRDRESTATGFRAGAEWTRGSIVAGAAFVVQDVDAVVPYGFWYDRGLEPVAGETVSGVEAYASLPLVWRQLRLEASYADFLTDPARPYLPARFGRAALEYHWIFRGGNLEPTLRGEVIGRAAARSLNVETGAFDAVTEPYAIFNLYVQIRVLDVRAFWRMDNVLNRDGAFDVPGFTLAGNRAMFGVRWFFRD